MKYLIDTAQVHLWWAALDVPEKEAARLSGFLSAEEAARAGRLLSDIHARRFTSARGMLRLLLGRYLGIAPEDAAIVRGEKGKPRLADADKAAPLCFNLSHCLGLALFGFCVNRRIGVDVEYIDSGRNHGKLAERFFRPRERQRILADSGPARHERFFRYWTVKEAYLKATGDGIGRLGDIEVIDDDRGGFRIRDTVAGYGSNWTVRPVCIRSGYAGAVAFDGALPVRVSVFHLGGEALTNL